MTLILNNVEITELLTMEACIATLDEALGEFAAGRGVTRQRSDTLVATSRSDGALYGLKTMDGIYPKAGVGAVRINSDLVTWPKVGGKQRRVKVPAAPGARYVGLVLLFSVETGEPLAIFPDGVVQRMRVGATNGLAIRLLAREDASTVGLLGSGWQAGAQLMAAAAVRKLSRVRCYSPTRENREAFAKEMSPVVGVEIEPVASPELAVAEADLVLCSTSSIDPVLQPEWVQPGMHLSSIKRPEISSDVIRRTDRTFLHTRDDGPIHSTTPGLEIPEKRGGKGQGPQEEVDFDTLPLLPDLVVGKVAGRQGPGEVTCFINNLGLGFQFAAVGAHLYARAKEQQVGQDLPTDWFTQQETP